MSRLDSERQALKQNWEAIKRYWKPIFGVLAIAAFVFIARTIAHTFKDSGLGELKVVEDYKYYRPAKTLWDLLQLLLLPLVTGLLALIGGQWFTSHQKKRDDESQTNRFREETLRNYLDKMTELMLNSDLRYGGPAPVRELQEIARYRTLTALRALDGERKATLLRFLHESRMIECRDNKEGTEAAEATSLLDMSGADLTEADLSDVDLERVDLHGADLSRADLRGARLNGARLYKAVLCGAKINEKTDFGGADLRDADLTNATYRAERLKQADRCDGIKPPELQIEIDRLRKLDQSSKRVREELLTVEQWLGTTDPIEHRTTIEYTDSSEKYGEWVVSRGTHTIGLLPKFSMGIYLVTNELYGKFVSSNGYENPEYWLGISCKTRDKFRTQDGNTYGPSTWRSQTDFSGREHHPVAGISYCEALAFCRWLNDVYPRGDGLKWCLPTEDMWELVARPEKNFLYPWGPNFAPCNSVEANIGTTTNVDRFNKGKSGCFDMAGNVWEFVKEDKEDHWYCVLRGGSYRNDRTQVKSSLRLWGVPRDHRPPDFGFRCALVSE